MMLLSHTDVPKFKWMLLLLKLDRVILMKGNVDYDDVEKIVNVIDIQIG